MEHPSKILKRHQLAPLKHLSQNFLVNTHSLVGLEKFFHPGRCILEIGPGLGAVTDYFFEKKFSLVVCEKDSSLARLLRDRYEAGVEVIHADFLDIPVEEWERRGVSSCVGNLPFHQTSEIILHIVKKIPSIEKCLWGVQKEVADRISSPTKSSSLSIFLGACGDLKPMNNIKKNSFYPVPQVDARWVFWERSPKVYELELFEVLLRSAFWGKRKTVVNALKNSPHIDPLTPPGWKAQIESPGPASIKKLLKKRADALNTGDYLKLFEWLNSA